MKKVLIIEDDPVVGTGYKLFLQSQGFETDLACDGVKGLERLTTFQPDAVVLDLMMPLVSGIDVLRTIRAQENLRALPVIVLTNAGDPAFLEQVALAGANRVFDKSKHGPAEILEALQNSLERPTDRRFVPVN